MRTLTSVIFKNSKRKDSKNRSTKREGMLSALSFGIVFVFLAILMALTSFYVTTKMAEFEQTYAFVNILLLMNFFLLFAKSIFESLNVLYFSKDLPNTTLFLIFSKTIFWEALEDAINFFLYNHSSANSSLLTAKP